MECYPELLKQIADPPIGLYSRGVLELERLRFIAIVGTRQPTLYGQKQAGRFAARLAGAATGQVVLLVESMLLHILVHWMRVAQPLVS